MDNGFTFGSRSTWDFPRLMVERYPRTTLPPRKSQTFTIPGRNGGLHMDEGAWDNYTQQYECYYHGDGVANEDIHTVKSWLAATAGYQRLTDVYDPSHYHLAQVSGTTNIQNILGRYSRFTVSFDCDPRAFLLSGDEAQAFAAAGTLDNPTAYIALPLITVRGSGAGAVTVGSATVEILEMDGEIILDCESANAYSLDGDVTVNENANISALEFPTLLPGENAVSFSGGISGVDIVPRWWEL